MPDDPTLSPASDPISSTTAESPNRPEPTIETPPSASESADLSAEAQAKVGTQPQSADTATESASIATKEPQIPPTPTPESVAPNPPQQPEGEAVSQFTPPVSEPTAMPPVQGNGTPETDQEKQEYNTRRLSTALSGRGRKALKRE